MPKAVLIESTYGHYKFANRTRSDLKLSRNRDSRKIGSNTFVFLGPLIYLKNQEFIDAHLNHAKELASAQATQVRDMAAQHTGRATESLKGYTSEYTKKAQEMMGQGKAKAGSTLPNAPSNEPFPNAPKEEPVARADEPAAVPAL